MGRKEAHLMLTKKQKDLLLYIHKRVQENGVSPSFDEMKDALDLKSKSGIHRLITALEERGFIRRLAHRARALEVIKLPHDLAPGETDGGAEAAPDNVVPFKAPLTEQIQGGIEVPLMGRIAAGVPISAIQDHTDDLVVSEGMVGAGAHYALEVHGDSMIEEGILDGDTVLIREGSHASNGDIVVAYLIEDEEATLKKFYKKGQMIELVAANPAYEPRVVSADKVEVQGHLVGLLRRYH